MAKTQGGLRDWPDIAGRIEGMRHILPVRVYFEDTDFTGLAYHGSYVHWFERGRSDFVRLLGIRHETLANPDDGGEPSAFVVRRLSIDYLKPARIDELLEVVTWCAETKAASLDLRQQVMRGDTILAKAEVQVVLVSEAGKPMRLGPMISGALVRIGQSEQ